jgi:hypothetical protein
LQSMFKLFFRQQEASHKQALQEEKKFLKLLKANGLTASDIQKLVDNAFAAIEAENWQPRKVKQKHKEPTKPKKEVKRKLGFIKD